MTLTGGAFEPGNVIRRAEALKDTFVELLGGSFLARELVSIL